MVDLLTTLPILLLFAAVVFRQLRTHQEPERPLLWASFVGHIGAGIGNILITKEFYDTGDVVAYYRFGRLAADRLREDFADFAPRLFQLVLQRPEAMPPLPLNTLSGSSASMQGISGFLMFLLNDSLYATCILIACVAFLTKLSLYSVAREQLPEVSGRGLLVACMLVPSAVFWSSTLLKEPIAMIGLLLAVVAAHEILSRNRRFRGLLLLLLGAPLLLIKGYLLPVLGVALASWYLVHAMRQTRADLVVKLGHVVLAGALAVAIILGTSALLPRFSLESLEDEFARRQVVGANVSGGTNYALTEGSGDTPQLALAPIGLLTALFRPMVFEATSALVLFNALEMAVFTVLVVVLVFRQRLLATLTEILRQPFLAFCITFVLTFGTCVGLASTNLGTLSRYRAPLIPFFAITLVALYKRRAEEPESASTGPNWNAQRGPRPFDRDAVGRA